MSITLIIILVTAAVSIPAFKNSSLFYRFDFSPYQVEKNKEWYRFFTHAFLHGDWNHLIFNMLALYLFGDVAQSYFEAYVGTKGLFYFLLLYVGGIMFATLSTYKKQKDNPNYHSVGASGAVSAVLFSYIIFSPAAELRLIIFPFFGLPSIVWGIAYLVYSHYQSKRGGDYINHDAHFSGAIFGVLFTVIAVPQSIVSFFAQILAIFS